MDLPTKWYWHLRQASQKAKPKIQCPLCGYGIQNPQDAHQAARANFEQHLADSHSQLLEEKTTDTGRTTWIESQWVAAQRCVATYFRLSFHFISFVLVFLSYLSLLCFDGVTNKVSETLGTMTLSHPTGRMRLTQTLRQQTGTTAGAQLRIEPQKGGVRIQGRFTTQAWVGRWPGRV
jgi:hypothetical protein